MYTHDSRTPLCRHRSSCKRPRCYDKPATFLMQLRGKCKINGRILLANLLQCSKSTFFSGKFPQLFCLQRRYVEHTNFATWGFANSIRALTVHVEEACRGYLEYRRSRYIEGGATKGVAYVWKFTTGGGRFFLTFP